MTIKFIGILLGGFLAFWGFNERKLNEKTTKDPQTVTMAELEKGNYNGSNHVVVTDFVYLNDQLIYQAEIGKYDNDVKPSSKVDYVYVPIVSKGHKFVSKLAAFYQKLEEGDETEEFPLLDDFSVIVKSKKYGTVSDLPSSFEVSNNTLQGIFVNKISKLNEEERNLLQQDSPGLDFDKVFILEEGRTPTSSAKAFGAMVGGGLISILSILWLFKRQSH